MSSALTYKLTLIIKHISSLRDCLSDLTTGINRRIIPHWLSFKFIAYNWSSHPYFVPTFGRCALRGGRRDSIKRVCIRFSSDALQQYPLYWLLASPHFQ